MITNRSATYDLGITEHDEPDVYTKWKELKVVVVDPTVKFIVF